MMNKFVVALFALVGIHPILGAQEQLDAELRETIVKVDVTVTDLYSRTETKPLVLSIFRPPGDGKHPLLILNHGRAVERDRPKQGRQRLHQATTYFVAQGFVVVVPTRIGYGETFSPFDPEYTGNCANAQLERKEEALFRQVMAAYDYAKTLDFVQAEKWVVAGQSLGGFTTVTVARRSPQGLVGAINFAGGYGGDPDNRRGNPCSPQAWERSLAKKSAAQKIPVLWLYWENDWYWGKEVPQRWFKSFQEGGGEGKLFQFGPIKGDGHSGFRVDYQNWTPAVSEYLKNLNLSLTPTEPAPTPPPSSFAAVGELEKIPFLRESGKEGYKTYLGRDSPKAFALNNEGKWSFSNGYWNTADRALKACNRGAKSPCRLYAVDDQVVWKP